MKPFMQIALSSGYTFEVPTRVIAENRAQAMLGAHPDEFHTLDDAMTDTVELFDDEYQIEDWAKNNMNPEEYLPLARIIRFAPPEQDFGAAEWKGADVQAIVGEPDHETIMRSPVDAVMSSMMESRVMCNIIALGSEGKTFGALVVIVGDENIVSTYSGALSFVTDRLTGKPQQH